MKNETLTQELREALAALDAEKAELSEVHRAKLARRQAWNASVAKIESEISAAEETFHTAKKALSDEPSDEALLTFVAALAHKRETDDLRTALSVAHKFADARQANPMNIPRPPNSLGRLIAAVRAHAAQRGKLQATAVAFAIDGPNPGQNEKGCREYCDLHLTAETTKI
jgi:hypothetical protein